MTRELVVRADADGDIGLGHIMRTMAVANELARTGTRVTYLSHRLSAWAAEVLDQRGFSVRLLELDDNADQAADAEATLAAIASIGADAVLLDQYGLTDTWTNRVKAGGNIFLAAFDDLAQNARKVDMLIDPSPGRETSDYANLIPDSALCLAGPRYAPLRPEFALARASARSDSAETLRLAISMGGVDPDGLTLTCLDALDGRDDVDLTIILSSDAKMLDAVQMRVSQMATPTQLLLDCTDMAKVLVEMDLVIGAGGTSALERCALGLPSVLAVIAENQSFNAEHLAQAGAVDVLPDLTPQTIKSTVEPLLTDAARRAEMGRKASQLCDGFGAARIGAALLGHHRNLRLRPVLPSDKDIIYHWQGEPGARAFSRSPHVPSTEEHATWFRNRLDRAEQDPFYIVETGGVPAGFVRLDAMNEPAIWEVSVLIAQAFQGRGLAHDALGLLRLAHPLHCIDAEVNVDNTASQNLFARAGYTRINETGFTSLGWSEIAEEEKDGN